MNKGISGSIDWLLSQGWAGVAVIALSAVVWVLWKDNKAKDVTIAALQEKRIEEARESLTGLQASTNSIHGLTTMLSTMLQTKS